MEQKITLIEFLGNENELKALISHNISWDSDPALSCEDRFGNVARSFLKNKNYAKMELPCEEWKKLFYRSLRNQAISDAKKAEVKKVSRWGEDAWEWLEENKPSQDSENGSISPINAHKILRFINRRIKDRSAKQIISKLLKAGDIEALFSDGKVTEQKIAHICGCNQSTVSRTLKKIRAELVKQNIQSIAKANDAMRDDPSPQ